MTIEQMLKDLHTMALQTAPLSQQAIIVKRHKK